MQMTGAAGTPPGLSRRAGTTCVTTAEIYPP